MCRNLILRYTCAHKHLVTLSPCRHTKSKLKRDGQLSPLCPAWRDTSQALVLRLSTPCPSCLALIKLETRVRRWLRVPIGREFGRMQVWAKEVQGAKHVEALMRVMKLGNGDARLLKRTMRSGDGVSYDRFGVNVVHGIGEEEVVRRMEREEAAAAIVVRKEMLEPLCGKKVHGGSPLRFELRIQDLDDAEEAQERDRERQEEEKEKEAEEEEDQEKKEDETMSWPDARAKLSSSDRESVTPSILKAKEEETETAKRQDIEMSDSLYFAGTGDVPWMFCLGYS